MTQTGSQIGICRVADDDQDALRLVLEPTFQVKPVGSE
jgi:hypothetical protein